MKKGLSMHYFFMRILPVISLFGCYSIKQSWYQVTLFAKREPVEDVLKNKKEDPKTLEKLKILQTLLTFSQDKLTLDTGGSYQKYIKIDGDYLTWIVQAASKNELRFKTWWFPFIGEQPYLGFFHKKDAIEFQKKLQTQGYDTVLGPVRAYSLLGYFSDPLYSTMVKNTNLVYFIETIIHELVHRTIFIENNTCFNENIANFIANKGTQIFLKNNLKYNQEYLEKYTQSSHIYQEHKKVFIAFLKRNQNELDRFYKDLKNKNLGQNSELFNSLREEKFRQIQERYRNLTKSYKNFSIGREFLNSKINNAVILSYALYDSKQDFFENTYKVYKNDIKKYVLHLKKCEESYNKDRNIWKHFASCLKL